MRKTMKYGEIYNRISLYEELLKNNKWITNEEISNVFNIIKDVELKYDGYIDEEAEKIEEVEEYQDIFIGNFKNDIVKLLKEASIKTKIKIEIVNPSCGTKGYVGVRVHKPNSLSDLESFWNAFELLRDKLMLGVVEKTIEKFSYKNIVGERILDLED